MPDNKGDVPFVNEFGKLGCEGVVYSPNEISHASTTLVTEMSPKKRAGFVL